MKHIAIFLFTCLCLAAQAEVQFKDLSWEEAKKESKESGKPIFLDAYTTWCSWCKWMDKNTFQDPELAKFINENFIAVKMDMEKGEGIDLEQKFAIDLYPTFIFADHNGEMVDRISGARDPQPFQLLAENALSHETQLTTLMQQYKEGERGEEFLMGYVDRLWEAGLEDESVVEQYFRRYGFEDLRNEAGWSFIERHINSSRQSAFASLVEQRSEFDEALESSVVDAFIVGVLNGELSRLSRSKSANEEDWSQMERSIERFSPATNAEALMAKLNYHRFSDSDEAHQYAVAYFDELCLHSGELNQIAWNYYENETNVDHLQAALRWAERSVELDRNFYNLDTQAHLQYSLGMKQEALAAAHEAASLAHEAGRQSDETDALISKIEEELSEKDQ